MQRLLELHDPLEHPVPALACSVQRPDCTGENATPRVKLKCDLALLDAEASGAIGVEDLLNLLQLHEVVARPDRPEPHTTQVEQQPRNLFAHPLAAAERVEVEPA